MNSEQGNLETLLALIEKLWKDGNPEIHKLVQRLAAIETNKSNSGWVHKTKEEVETFCAKIIAELIRTMSGL